SLVHLRRYLLGHEVVEAARVAHQFEAEGAEQSAVLVLHAGQLGRALRLAAREVVALERVAEGCRELGPVIEIAMHACTRFRSAASPRPFTREGLGERETGSA